MVHEQITYNISETVQGKTKVTIWRTNSAVLHCTCYIWLIHLSIHDPSIFYYSETTH